MLVTKTDLRKATNAALFRRGEQLFKQGAVTILDLKEAAVQGNVQDTQYRYRQVSIRQLPTGQLSAQCSCFAQSYPCLHTVAVLLAYLDEMERAGRIESAAPSWEDYLNNLPQLRQRRSIETEAQITKLLFFIQLNPQKWRLQPMPTYIKKNGELGRRSRLQFGYDGALYGDIEATSAELKAINAMKHRLRASGNSYGYSSDYFEFEYGEEAGFILDMLAESRLHLEESERPLRVINSASQLFFELSNGVTGSNGQPAYQFFPQLQLNGHPEKLDDNYRILTSRPFWMLKGEKILRVENSFPAPYLLPFTRKGYQLQIPAEKVEAFLQGFVPHLKHDIKLVLPENLSLQTAREVTGRRLYLREQNEALCVEPRFVYGEIEVGNLHDHQINIPALTNGANGHSQTLWRVERDHTAEAAIHEALVAAGLKLDESREFYAPNQEPLVWLFDELPKLATAGFEIFGEETLKRHRLNRATPNVRVAVSSDIDWFDLNVEIDFGGVMLSLANLKQAVRQENQFVKLADGSLARLPEEWQKRFQHFFNFAKVDGKNGDAQIASSHAMLIDALFDEAEEKRYDENFSARLTKLKNFKGIAEVPAPKNFQGELRPYQQFGLNWLGFLKEYGFNGCLADDMGLGKTVQALAFLLREKLPNHQAEETEKGGKREEPKTATRSSEEKQAEARPASEDTIKVTVIPRKELHRLGRGKYREEVSATPAESLQIKNNGATRRTSLIVAPLSVLFNWEKECARFAPELELHIHHGLDRAKAADAFAEYDIVLTTYATMRLDVEFLKDFPFHYIILDESQNIKNPISQTAKAASIMQSNHRLVLTGTPVENNTVELWSQFSFLNPGMLGNLTYFQNSFSVPIERYSDEGAAKLLKKMISPFLLRRTKEEVVKELPPKSEQIYYCAMSDSQKRLYQQVRDQYRAEIMNMIDTSGLQDARFRVLQGLTKLRQLACHPNLIFENSNYDSGKFDAFLELLREIVAEGHKVLVFSQFVRMLKIVGEELKKEKITFEVLTGATRDRQACVTRFQEDPKTKVFLISLKAGGLGLNLTAADYVMIYDPWWNPAAERQAIDRAHRIGQDKNVFVYKMITRGTVEEKILELQKRKANLVSQLISTDAGLFKHLTAEDIRGLFS